MGSSGSATLVAAACIFVIIGVAIGGLLLVSTAGADEYSGGDSLTRLVTVANQICKMLDADLPTTDLRKLAAEHGASLVPLHSSDGSAPPDVPANPVLTPPNIVEKIYSERTGAPERARAFVNRMTSLVETGRILMEEDIRRSAGMDYQAIQGLITAEPVLNVNEHSAESLVQTMDRTVGACFAAGAWSGEADGHRLPASLVADLAGIVERPPGQPVWDAEVSALIERAASLSSNPEVVAQRLSALLGTRTWVWVLRMERPEWTAEATIALLPGHPRAVVSGIRTEP